MRQGTARGPSAAKTQISPRQTEAGRAAARTHSAEAADFLETAAGHLREAGYSVELEFDHEADEASLYVDGVEVRFVRHRPRRGAIKH
ncbi:MAG TPA: hypothetical protein VKZ79_14930 [Alphaproteobacteria bacterium]|nr:hypothetical protein [Alphaproteobacteria bacterium]